MTGITLGSGHHMTNRLKRWVVTTTTQTCRRAVIKTCGEPGIIIMTGTAIDTCLNMIPRLAHRNNIVVTRTAIPTDTFMGKIRWQPGNGAMAINTVTDSIQMRRMFANCLHIVMTGATVTSDAVM